MMMVCNERSRRKTERFDSVWRREQKGMQRQECALHPNVTGSLSRSTSEEGSRNLEPLRWQLKGNRRKMTVRKAMDPQQHDDERRSVLVRNRYRLPKRWTLFSSPPSTYVTLFNRRIRCRSALPPNDRHGDKRTTADGRRFMLTTSKKSSIAFRTVMYSNRGSRRHNNN
jgi:hypothetical protein